MPCIGTCDRIASGESCPRLGTGKRICSVFQGRSVLLALVADAYGNGCGARKTPLNENSKQKPSPFRLQRDTDNKIIVASLIENPAFGSATLFVQLLANEQGNRLSRDEHRRELEQYLFQGDDKFRMRLQGCFGAFKPRVQGATTEQALAMFGNAMLPVFRGCGQEVLSAEGKEYVKLRLEEWCEQ